jgi:hypothetical protein
MPKFYRQNKKRIDPRYFLNETTNRDLKDARAARDIEENPGFEEEERRLKEGEDNPWKQGSTLNSDEMRAMAGEMDQAEDNAYAPTEDNQEPIVTANNALHEALEALEALEAVTKFNMDSRITLADLDYKIVKINRAWRRIQGG